jgi:hypothetical protein
MGRLTLFLVPSSRGPFLAPRDFSRLKPMPHKFKIGETVVYRNTRRARADGSIFMIIGYLNESNGEPTYRIKHVDKGTARSKTCRADT